MDLIRKLSIRQTGNSVKGKTISLKTKEFQIVEDKEKKVSSLSPKPADILKKSRSSKTLFNSPVIFNTFNKPSQVLTPTPLKLTQETNERRSSVCLKLSNIDSLARRSVLGGNSSRDPSSTQKGFLGISDMYTLNGNLLLASTERNKSPDFELPKRKSKKKKIGTKKISPNIRIRHEEIKLPKFAFEVKKIACQVKSSKKKKLVIV